MGAAAEEGVSLGVFLCRCLVFDDGVGLSVCDGGGVADGFGLVVNAGLDDGLGAGDVVPAGVRGEVVGATELVTLGAEAVAALGSRCSTTVLS